MSPRLLLVEDSPTILNLISLMLKQEGYSVETARDGLEGLEKLSRQPVDLIVTDVNMPRMDGLKFIESVRKQAAFSKLPIIVLSTESDPLDKQEGLRHGANLYLTKPVRPQDLVMHVRQLLEG